jgi:hydrogenase maturation protein HypF
MAPFDPCQACAADYADPSSRRFHAETIACAACGPRLSHTPEEIAAALLEGLIVALKGIGGFHLLCDASNAAAVGRLRMRKRRPHKPFAVMVADAAALSPWVRPTPKERDLLGQCARPIVLVRKGLGLVPAVAPRLGRVGIMLAGTPVHHLLFQALDAEFALVATSANRAGEPLAIDNDAATRDLDGLADVIVTHDRAILARADDSVMAVIDGAPAFIRRGRGFTPAPIDLGEDGPRVLAVGAHLKATVCVTRGREAFVSQHLGDLDTPETVRFHHETARHMLAALGIKPDIVVCDLHPNYRSTLLAEATGLPLLRVQHHAAHLAAVAAEHRLAGPLVGVALDGHGHGDDGGAWGGELMARDDAGWRRVGHLRPLALPGGDRAAREPWRMAVAAMAALGRGDEAAERFPGQALAPRLAKMILANPEGPSTTSLGRLFDAAAGLLGVCEEQTYDGQAAMRLETLADHPRCVSGGFQIEGNRLDFRPLLSALLEPGLTARDGASLFHGVLIAGLADWIDQYADECGVVDVALGGGCLMNRTLTDGLTEALRARGLVPWLSRAVPANDGGISLGQAAMARASLMGAAAVSATEARRACA